MGKQQATHEDVMAFLEAVYPGAANLALASFNEKACLADASALLGRLRADKAQLLAACWGALQQFDNWAGPEESVCSGRGATAARARNKNVRAYEAIRVAVEATEES